jgi:undecaprenyl-diphosphatase
MIGGTVWAVVVSMIGYLAGAGFREVEHRLNIGAGVAVGVIAAVVLIVVVVRHLRARNLPDDDDLSTPTASSQKGSS